MYYIYSPKMINDIKINIKKCIQHIFNYAQTTPSYLDRGILLIQKFKHILHVLDGFKKITYILHTKFKYIIIERWSDIQSIIKDINDIYDALAQAPTNIHISPYTKSELHEDVRMVKRRILEYANISVAGRL